MVYGVRMYDVVEAKSSYSTRKHFHGELPFLEGGAHCLQLSDRSVPRVSFLLSPGSSFIFNVEWVQHSRNARVSISDLAQTIETVKAARRVTHNPREHLRV